MPFLSDGDLYPTWNGKAKFINYDGPSMERPAGAQAFPWSPRPVPAPPVEAWNPRVGWGRRFAFQPPRTSVPQEYLNKVRPVLDDDKRVNRTVTASLPQDWKDLDERQSVEMRPSTIRTVQGLGGPMYLTADDLYYDPRYDVRGMGSLGKSNFFKKISKGFQSVAQKVSAPLQKALVKTSSPLVKVMQKTMQGKQANRVAFLLGGPAAPLLNKLIFQTLADPKKGLLTTGKVAIPAMISKSVQKVPVLNKIITKDGKVDLKGLVSKSALIPGFAIAEALKKQPRRTPAQVTAQAAVESAKEIAAEQGQDFTQVMEQPSNQQQIENGAVEAMREEQRRLQELKWQAQEEQQARYQQMEQFTQPQYTAAVPTAPGALPREAIIEEQKAVVYSLMAQYNIEPTPENIEMLSKRVAEQWVQQEQGEIEAAKAQEEYASQELEAVQEANKGVTEGMKVGGDWGGEGFSPE